MQASSSVARPGNPSFGRGGFGKKTQGTWRGGSWGRGLPLSDSVRSTSQPTVKSSQQEQGAVKTYNADASLDYMHFLEECRKSKEEEKAGQARAVPKAKAAAATVPPIKQDERTKQLRYQQQ